MEGEDGGDGEGAGDGERDDRGEDAGHGSGTSSGTRLPGTTPALVNIITALNQINSHLNMEQSLNWKPAFCHNFLFLGV